MSERAALIRLREQGLVGMGPTGHWELTTKGVERIEEMRLLYKIERTSARDMHDPRGMTAGSGRAGRRERGG